VHSLHKGIDFPVKKVYPAFLIAWRKKLLKKETPEAVKANGVCSVPVPR
jgi:hypothetical protein